MHIECGKHVLLELYDESSANEASDIAMQVFKDKDWDDPNTEAEFENFQYDVVEPALIDAIGDTCEQACQQVREQVRNGKLKPRQY